MTAAVTSSVFAPAASAPPAAPRPADDGAASFRQVMDKAQRGQADDQADDQARARTDTNATSGDKPGAQIDAKPGASQDDAQTAAAQQAAMQALARAGLTPPAQVAPATALPNQLDAMSQLQALSSAGVADATPGLATDAKAATAKPATDATDAVAATAATTAATTAAIDPRLAALLGAMTPTQPTAIKLPAVAKPATPAPAAVPDTPLPAAAARPAVTVGAAPTDAPDAAALAASKAAAALAAAGDTAHQAALTPLEQSVHELLSERAGVRHGDKLALDDDDDPLAGADDDPTASQTALGQLAAQPATPQGLTGVTRSAELDPTRPAALAQPPDAPSNPSHVHLVLDDGPDRVVMTVAVRGNDIHVALRGSDDATTNALARNAASLDNAMRARGLHLSQLTAERDRQAPRDTPQRQDAEPREQRKPNERFKLEENL